MDYKDFVKVSLDDAFGRFLIDSTYPYWQKYVEGINMTVLKCSPTNQCSFPMHKDKLYTAIKSNDVCLL